MAPKPPSMMPTNQRKSARCSEVRVSTRRSTYKVLMNEQLPRVRQPDRTQPRGFLVPAGALLHVQEQMHPALKQSCQLLPRLCADRLDALATLTDEDRPVAWTRDVHRGL